MFPYYLLPGNKPKPKPKPKPESHSNPYVAVPGDFLSPAPATPQTPSTANPPAERPSYGPENPAPPNYGGPGPVYPGISSAPKPTSSSSSSGKKPDRGKESSDKQHSADQADMIQSEATPDISAFDLEYGWSSHQLEVGSDDELVAAVAKSVQHEGLFEHYYDDLIGYLKNFASYGWDGKADRQAEAHLQKYKEKMVAGKDELWQGLALGATEGLRKDLSNDRLESAVAVNIVTKEEIFRRFGDEDETPLQEENRAMIKDPNNTALIHNHWNDSPGSQADFDAALWLGVRYLIVVTPSGLQYIYERNGDTMKLLDEIFNREHVALPSPAETAESRAAYAAQALAEIGNPAERVMRQEEPFWWQRDYIVVPYNTGETNETIEEVAARLISPRPIEFPNDDPHYNQLYERYLIESEEIPRLLRELNPLNSGTDTVNIPVPGWHFSAEYGSSLHDGRTLGIPLSSPYLLRDWWVGLSRAEQEIEMALTATANTRPDSANFDNMQTFDSVMSWIARNDETIGANAVNGLPRELLELVMASEFLFDYSDRDGLQDFGIRHNIVPDERAWNGVGVANVHYATLFEAYYYTRDQLPEGVEHPWHSIPNAPDLSIVAEVKPDDAALQAKARDTYVPQRRWTEDSDYYTLAPEQQEAVKFTLLDTLYSEELKNNPELRTQIAQFLVTDEGSIHAASMVTRMYMDEYIRTNWEDPQDILRIAQNLSPEDMARIWGRYRSGLELFETYPAMNDEMGPNALLALPIAEYLLEDQ